MPDYRCVATTGLTHYGTPQICNQCATWESLYSIGFHYCDKHASENIMYGNDVYMIPIGSTTKYLKFKKWICGKLLRR
jgi:hypothetical protein